MKTNQFGIEYLMSWDAYLEWSIDVEIEYELWPIIEKLKLYSKELLNSQIQLSDFVRPEKPDTDYCDYDQYKVDLDQYQIWKPLWKVSDPRIVKEYSVFVATEFGWSMEFVYDGEIRVWIHNKCYKLNLNSYLELALILEQEKVKLYFNDENGN